MEKDLKALRDSSASKEDISRVRAEMKKLYDGLHVGQYLFEAHACPINDRLPEEFLDLRSHVWGMRKLPTSRLTVWRLISCYPL